MKLIQVKIADLSAARDRAVLVTIGLGSCIGVSLYDPVKQVGGLAHILLSDSRPFKELGRFGNPAKFADTAVPLLIKQMVTLGADQKRVIAKIAGGSQLFFSTNSVSSVGKKNIKAVHAVLEELQIPLIGKDVGGNYGRTMRVFVDSGKVLISTVGRGEREI